MLRLMIGMTRWSVPRVTPSDCPEPAVCELLGSGRRFILCRHRCRDVLYHVPRAPRSACTA